MEASSPSTNACNESNGNSLKIVRRVVVANEIETTTTARRWSSSSIPSSIFLLFFFLLFASQFTFLVASRSVPTISPISPPPSSSVLKTTQPKHTTHLAIELKILIPILVSALFLALLFVMGFLKFLRFRIRRKRSIVVVAGDGDQDRREKSSIVESSLRRFSWDEVQRLTMNFSSVIGSGGFSTVYLAQFSDSTLGAVKIHSSSERLNRAYKQELDILLRLRHDNIVKLLGHCDDREEGVLVFEYVSNGSLQEKLHGGNGSVLSWKTRMAIAFQLAQAIEYLHEQCDLQIVHGDIKASNILLDEMLNCKLCDFGSAKMGFSSTVLPPSSSSAKTKQLMMGSLGYVDPLYMRTGIASKKNDVYSFGVIVLELITGMEAFCSEKGKMLTSIAGPMLVGHGSGAAAVAEMADPRLGGGFDLEELKVMASISGLCLGVSPGIRPSASDILRTMREKITSISFLFSEGKKV
ncbi:probable receptor-like protein kinase At4g10390 [Cornus florida]|uniref:probable receptor-like protein kinase At4g10390 n=1 Tax=Cornus florida TaxID=4283 RepID=UPI0028A12C53|nr:probable receptor-like protein kinase At4g10390 [Cornus florida]